MSKNVNELYELLSDALRREVAKNRLAGASIRIRCTPLESEAAIGRPEHRDYPIILGKEKMIEAEFKGARGQAFTDHFRNADYTIDEFMAMQPDDNWKRAHYIAGLNAVFRYLDLCDKTVHCKDAEPVTCARMLAEKYTAEEKVLLIGLQPRFLEHLSGATNVRVIDLDADNVGTVKFGVPVEPVANTGEAISWCDRLLVTGSTIVNGSITSFLQLGKPVFFYGVTISAPALILGFDVYCGCGR